MTREERCEKIERDIKRCLYAMLSLVLCAVVLICGSWEHYDKAGLTEQGARLVESHSWWGLSRDRYVEFESTWHDDETGEAVHWKEKGLDEYHDAWRFRQESGCAERNAPEPDPHADCAHDLGDVDLRYAPVSDPPTMLTATGTVTFSYPYMMRNGISYRDTRLYAGWEVVCQGCGFTMPSLLPSLRDYPEAGLADCTECGSSFWAVRVVNR
jgi:hypothetical protein